MTKSMWWVCAMSLVAFGGGCGEEAPDDPVPEALQQEGVYGVAPRPVGGVPSVVTLTPRSIEDGGTEGLDPQGEAVATVDQLGVQFNPTQLIVPVGAGVVFTNSEAIAHNVHLRFADNDSTVLDVDTDPAERAEHVFDTPGGYHLTCDSHPSMQAFIYVTTAPYTTFADADGSFRITGVPAGSYQLSIWSVDPGLRGEVSVDVSGARTEVEAGTSGS